jgi:hypothetical protein
MKVREDNPEIVALFVKPRTAKHFKTRVNARLASTAQTNAIDTACPESWGRSTQRAERTA